MTGHLIFETGGGGMLRVVSMSLFVGGEAWWVALIVPLIDNRTPPPPFVYRPLSD